MKRKLKIHQHKIKKRYSCGMKFYLEEILQVKREAVPHFFLTGSAVHEVISTLHKDKELFRYPNDILPIMLRSELELQEGYYKNRGMFVTWPSDKKKLVDTFVDDYTKAIINYCQKDYNDPDAYTLLANEFSFSLDIGKNDVRGTIDQVRLYDSNSELISPMDGDSLAGRIVLIDLKTDANYPNQAFLDRDVQLSLYSLACKEAQSLISHKYVTTEDGKVVKKAQEEKPILELPDEIWYYMLVKHIPYKKGSPKKGPRAKTGRSYNKGDERGDPRYNTYRREKQLEFTRNQIKQFAREVNYASPEVYQPNPSTLQCVNCSVASHCMTTMIEYGENKVTSEQVESLFEQAGLNLEEQLQ